jgi:predicted PurR-regulated permease PerM
VGELGGKAASFAVTGLASGTRGTARFFMLLFVMLYGIYFFLQQGRGILDRALHYVPISEGDKHRMLETFTTVTRASLKGTGVIGIVQGVLGGVAFALAGITGPVFWGLLMAVFSVLPGVGPAIVWVPAVIYLALEGRIVAAIVVGLWCFAVVSTVDNVLRPWLVGKDTKMPDLLVLLGTLGGLVLFGVVGVIVGPIIAALFVTIWELFGAAVDQMRKPAEQTRSETAT